ncbi:MAG: tRNA 2-thiouridine(34) synthase MnmA [Coriobacteriia bacterium]|nr:tRNA 2-thiouridine(34) synthase MnmA [Coriobacteriia bacterium]
MKKALIAMSGGVDSSVAAKLTQDAGFECIGCTMKLYGGEPQVEGNGKTCCALDDVEDARSVAHRIGIPYYVFNFTGRFDDLVIERFVESYEAGRTPNPCIDCNRFLKFDALLHRARELGCDHMVTGHYAQVGFDGQRYTLSKATDRNKDQSYVLYTLTQEQLAMVRFPLGGMTKDQVRQIAQESGFVNAQKGESQDICFVPDGDYVGFIQRRTGKEYPQGEIVDVQGNVLGQHQGAIRYTVGQRKGLGIALGRPQYVKDLDVERNQVVVGDLVDLQCTELLAGDFNWIAGEVPDGPVPCKAKVRYRQEEQPAVAVPVDEKTVKVVFDEPQTAVARGQAVVLYDGDLVLGGGVMEKVL